MDLNKANIPPDHVPLIEWYTRFSSKQHQFIDALADHFEVIYLGGNSSGKTRALYWTLTALALGYLPGQDELGLTAPLRIKVLINDFEHGLDGVAYETLFGESTLPDGKRIGPMCPKSMISRRGKRPWSAEDRSLRFKNKSVITWMTSEQKRKLHAGTTFDILACDEEPGWQQYDESKRGLRGAKGGGRVLWAFTPLYEEGRGPSWSKERILDPFEAGELPKTNVIRAKMTDNPVVTKEYIEQFMRGKTDEQIRVQMYGEYPTFGKMCFPDFQDFLWNPETKVGHLLPHDWPVPFHDHEANFEFAMDWHPSKPTAAIWTVTTRDGVIVYDELAPLPGDKTPGDLVEIFHQKEGYRFGRNKLRIRRYADPKMKDKSNVVIRGMNAWRMFEKEGLYLTEGYNRQPEVGISIINDFLRGDTKTHPRLFILEHCTTLRKSMKEHYWRQNPDGTGKPDPKYSDYPICLRYILQQRGKDKVGPKKRKWSLTSYGDDSLPYYPHKVRAITR